MKSLSNMIKLISGFTIVTFIIAAAFVSDFNRRAELNEGTIHLLEQNRKYYADKFQEFYKDTLGRNEIREFIMRYGEDYIIYLDADNDGLLDDINKDGVHNTQDRVMGNNTHLPDAVYGSDFNFDEDGVLKYVVFTCRPDTTELITHSNNTSGNVIRNTIPTGIYSKSDFLNRLGSIDSDTPTSIIIDGKEYCGSTMLSDIVMLVSTYSDTYRYSCVTDAGIYAVIYNVTTIKDDNQQLLYNIAADFKSSIMGYSVLVQGDFAQAFLLRYSSVGGYNFIVSNGGTQNTYNTRNIYTYSFRWNNQDSLAALTAPGVIDVASLYYFTIRGNNLYFINSGLYEGTQISGALLKSVLNQTYYYQNGSIKKVESRGVSSLTDSANYKINSVGWVASESGWNGDVYVNKGSNREDYVTSADTLNGIDTVKYITLSR